MMRNLALALLTVGFVLPYTGNAQQSSFSCNIETWKHGAKAAITYTFDDGCSNQFNKGIPIFDKYGYKATFFVVTSWIKDWNEIARIHDVGHEVASHTVSHPNLGNLSPESAENELALSKKQIEEHIPGYTCKTMAYPYCVPTDSMICERYYLAARQCQGYIEEKTPKIFYGISSIPCGSESSIVTAIDLEKYFQQALAKKGWLVLLLHGIDDDGGYSEFSSEEMEKSLGYLKRNSKDYWVDTFGSIALYAKERGCAKVTAVTVGKKSVSFSLTDSLDNNIYNQPLTLTVQMPKGRKRATVVQNGKSLLSEVYPKDSLCFVRFNVVPDSGEIKILYR